MARALLLILDGGIDGIASLSSNVSIRDVHHRIVKENLSAIESVRSTLHVHNVTRKRRRKWLWDQESEGR